MNTGHKYLTHEFHRATPILAMLMFLYNVLVFIFYWSIIALQRVFLLYKEVNQLYPCRLLFFFKIFLMRTIFKVFIEYVTMLLLFFVFIFWPQSMWDF